ncbi:hypothetical protein DFH94DRAFT_843466 [Russula ochroleuca]|uniref:Uncharacterized protein n=1 Tax=Russula ochroleuca TaxID=152965 RepID=A0A9P5N1I0_9AGAM|nr:hypothetical protein DFH94DRAFT_843466 [Russula ochroleuca]
MPRAESGPAMKLNSEQGSEGRNINAPTNYPTQQFTVQLPIGTKCTGGTGKDHCLASFTTTSGFGNFIVVSQATEAADLAQSQLKTDESTHVQSRPAEDDEKRNVKDEMGDKSEGIMADKHQSGTAGEGKKADKRQWGTFSQGKRADKRQSSVGTSGDANKSSIEQGSNNQNGVVQGSRKRVDKRQSDDHVVTAMVMKVVQLIYLQYGSDEASVKQEY